MSLSIGCRLATLVAACAPRVHTIPIITAHTSFFMDAILEQLYFRVNLPSGQPGFFSLYTTVGIV
jgi:hypothetical protein